MTGDVRMALGWVHTTTVNAVYHVVRVDGPFFVAACNQWVHLDTSTERSLSATTPGFRCNRPACRNRWSRAEDGDT